MFHAADLLHELGSSSAQERAGDLFPRIYYAAFRSANRKHVALLYDQAFSTWAVNLCRFQQQSQLSVEHHYVRRNEIIPQDVCGWERSPRRGVLMETVGRSDRYRIWCAHQKRQVVALIMQRLRGQKDRSAETFGISCDSSRFLFVLTGKSCSDKRNPNCFLDPQSWRRRTWIDQRCSNQILRNWVNERKCSDLFWREDGSILVDILRSQHICRSLHVFPRSLDKHSCTKQKLGFSSCVSWLCWPTLDSAFHTCTLVEE